MTEAAQAAGARDTAATYNLSCDLSKIVVGKDKHGNPYAKMRITTLSDGQERSITGFAFGSSYERLRDGKHLRDGPAKLLVRVNDGVFLVVGSPTLARRPSLFRRFADAVAAVWRRLAR